MTALALSSSRLDAQLVSYFTQGYFTGGYAPCNMAAPLITDGPVSSTCAGNGLTLEYLSTTATDILNGSIVSLGRFTLDGTGTADVAPGNVFFHLLINQTSPVTGSGVFLGAISGSVSTVAGNFSSLIWTPNQDVTIGIAHYDLNFDHIGFAAGTGLGIPVNGRRGIDAVVTATPEPATLGLVAVGLFGFGGVVSRRKRRPSAGE